MIPRLALPAILGAALAIAPASPAVAATNDPLSSLQWGPRQIRAEQAWSTSRGDGAVIAVVDSGVDLSHPDLAGQLVPGATFAGCAESSCGNGDWTSGRDSGEPHPHGTHVAGIAAAATGNGIGIAGVAPNAKIMPIKALGEEGGTFAEIAAGVRWATAHGADVINLSLGALPGAQAFVITGLEDEAEKAIADAVAAGVVVVAAAGNESFPVCDTPSFGPGALCVTATDPNEAVAWYSNAGLKPGLDAVAAPGGAGTLFCEDDVISTVPAAAAGTCSDILGTPGYDAYAGTSMATPHVAGVAALLAAQQRSGAEIVDVLESTARTPGSGARGTYTPHYGYGIVDAQAAVAAPRTGGGAPAPQSCKGKRCR